MRHAKLNSALLLLLLNVFAPAALAGGGSQFSEAEQAIYKELLKLPYYGVFDHIRFQVVGDRIVLSGQVTRPTLKKSAERVVKGVETVTEVENRIEVLPLSGFDDRIRLSLFRSIYGRGDFLRYGGVHAPIRIIVKNGHVTLEGAVATELEKSLAFHRARGVSGVFSVTNNLVT